MTMKKHIKFQGNLSCCSEPIGDAFTHTHTHSTQRECCWVAFLLIIQTKIWVIVSSQRPIILWEMRGPPPVTVSLCVWKGWVFFYWINDSRRHLPPTKTYLHIISTRGCCWISKMNVSDSETTTVALYHPPGCWKGNSSLICLRQRWKSYLM